MTNFLVATFATSTTDVLSNVLFISAIALLGTVFMVMLCYRFLQIYQLSSYSLARFTKGLTKTRTKLFLRLAMLVVLTMLATLTMTAVFYKLIGEYAVLIGIIISILFFAIYVYKDIKKDSKTPLRFTARMIRLYVLVGILTFASIFCYAYFVDVQSQYLKGQFFAFLPFISLVVTYLAILIMTPFEKLNNLRYIKSAKRKMKKLSNLKVVAITGSCGKTTLKNIVSEILATKFNTVKTPASFNTPLGIVKTIRTELTEQTEIFVCEMGARKIGDINTLTKIATPDVSVVSSIAPQHIEYFKTIENIEKTKFEIVEAVKQNGVAIFANQSTVNLFGKATCSKVFVPNEMTAKNIVFNKSGTTFDVVCENEAQKIETVLVGMHNVENILTAVCVCKQFGMSLEEIAKAVKNIKAIPHRLQVISGENNVCIIDDSYNSNPVASKMAIDFVSSLECKGKKIIVTPGFVELGEMQKQSHIKLAKNISEVFQRVILCGAIQTKAIYDELVAKEFSKDDIIIVNDLQATREALSNVVSENDVVLLLNDLPDNYTENV